MRCESDWERLREREIERERERERGRERKCKKPQDFLILQTGHQFDGHWWSFHENIDWYFDVFVQLFEDLFSIVNSNSVSQKYPSDI